MKETISGARVTKGQFSPLEAPCFSLLNFSGLHGSLHRPPLRHTSSCACSLLPFSFLKFFEKQKISSYKNLSKCYFYLSLEKKSLTFHEALHKVLLVQHTRITYIRTHKTYNLSFSLFIFSLILKSAKVEFK